MRMNDSKHSFRVICINHFLYSNRKSKNMKDYGKRVQWPSLTTKSLKQTDDYMKKIYKR
jgi:hypothetical protein